MSLCRFAAITVVLLCTAVPVGFSVRHAPNDQARAVSQPAFAEKIYLPGVSDFGKVNDFLYRGAQPKDDGVEQLKKIGIDTIVDLRSELHGLISNERQRAESLGIRYINLPGSGWSTAKDEQIAQFFWLVRERPRRKVFIHCWLAHWVKAFPDRLAQSPKLASFRTRCTEP
jgi:protein tyrosine phosphatase (PTP) superfamily phosphohydrolase (DUF442 family)